MSLPEAERVLLSASRVEASFLEPRERIAHHIPAVKQPYSLMDASTCSWRVLTFISDRFLLSADSDAVIIWDTSTLASSSPAVASSPWAHFSLSNFLGYVHCYSTLYIAIARVQQRSVAFEYLLIDALSYAVPSFTPFTFLRWAQVKTITGGCTRKGSFHCTR